MCGPNYTPPSRDYESQSFVSVVQASATIVGEIVGEDFPLTFEGFTYHGYIAYRRGAKPAPVILICPNYAGLKQFDKDQAQFLAALGYVGLALDLYQTPYDTRNPARSASKEVLKKHFYLAFNAMNDRLRNPITWRALMRAYLTQARQHAAVHPRYAAAIGYCFGGQCVLEMVRGGFDVQGVVSFHGILQSKPANYLQLKQFDDTVNDAGMGNKYTTECHVLIENGELDNLVTPKSVAAFAKEMNDAGVHWRFNNHAQTPHGFALAEGVWSSAYTREADYYSTLSMMTLFANIFSEFPLYPIRANACGTKLQVALTKL
eukprot:NODE_512_length_1410_cov_96.604053_g478_i0.p1 GENE.NODE_512_length_1410_cov_96.604053_g478_i0~~NODE_512_length_1410_cov_96.604053_g478_i0.p1  ORF type:complete len:318 (-),score=40.88 NODE_512_length_1410_cov_96.604053_g478_i0:24-977(-)